MRWKPGVGCTSRSSPSWSFGVDLLDALLQLPAPTFVRLVPQARSTSRTFGVPGHREQQAFTRQILVMRLACLVELPVFSEHSS